MRRVVITGLGPITPIGTGNRAFHEAQLAGRSGVRNITHFDVTGLPVQIAGEVDFNPEDWFDKREIRRLDRFSQFALVAAQLALEDAGLDPASLEPSTTGVVVGTGVGGIETWEAQSKILLERGPTRINPFFIPSMIANMATAHVAMRYGFMGPTLTPVAACATGSDAIGNAYRMIQYGEAEVVLAGGSEAAVTPMTLGGFMVIKALSTRNDDPAAASRPFSADRDGFVLAEGAAILVMENYEHAKARGAQIYAEIVGFGRTSDAHHITEPHPEGLGAKMAMEKALKEAGAPLEAVGYINAHGTSTAANDRAETLAIKHLFGDHAQKIGVSSTKSMTGHEMGAAGAIEAVATIQALVSGVLPPTINYNPDPELDLDYIPNQPREQKVEYALSNSFAFGGHNAVVLFKRV